jgi:hypothetical protein
MNIYAFYEPIEGFDQTNMYSHSFTKGKTRSQIIMEDPRTKIFKK